MESAIREYELSKPRIWLLDDLSTMLIAFIFGWYLRTPNSIKAKQDVDQSVGDAAGGSAFAGWDAGQPIAASPMHRNAGRQLSR